MIFNSSWPNNHYSSISFKLSSFNSSLIHYFILKQSQQIYIHFYPKAENPRIRRTLDGDLAGPFEVRLLRQQRVRGQRPRHVHGQTLHRKLWHRLIQKQLSWWGEFYSKLDHNKLVAYIKQINILIGLSSI